MFNRACSDFKTMPVTSCSPILARRDRAKHLAVRPNHLPVTPKRLEDKKESTEQDESALFSDLHINSASASRPAWRRRDLCTPSKMEPVKPLTTPNNGPIMLDSPRAPIWHSLCFFPVLQLNEQTPPWSLDNEAAVDRLLFTSTSSPCSHLVLVMSANHYSTPARVEQSGQGRQARLFQFGLEAPSGTDIGKCMSNVPLYSDSLRTPPPKLTWSLDADYHYTSDTIAREHCISILCTTSYSINMST